MASLMSEALGLVEVRSKAEIFCSSVALSKVTVLDVSLSKVTFLLVVFAVGTGGAHGTHCFNFAHSCAYGCLESRRKVFGFAAQAS